MATLADYISINGRFARSANLERDASRTEPLDGYIVTARALDAVERIAATAASGPAGGAWSLTGPYGSGKSSLALLLDAAFGGPGPARDAAWALLDEASLAVGDRVREAHRRHGTERHGFHRGLVTADREPINQTILRALNRAVVRRHGDVPTGASFPAAKLLREALADAASKDPRRTGPSPAALVEIARCVAREAPLLLIIDEFGKNLEAASEGAAADPYLLQQLAEAGQGSGLPIFTLTLQHLSFEDYLAGADDTQRREWVKVQGRFEDIAYVESPVQTRALIATVFTITNQDLQTRVRRWAERQSKAMTRLGLVDLSDPDTIASCYPLHPLASAVLPELCNRYGQNERTLFSFLTGPAPGTVASFLKTARIPNRGTLPVLGLDTIYDYFVGSPALSATAAVRTGRWSEIATRLRDTHGLTPSQTALAKAIAVLNLVSASGSLRASHDILALTGSDADTTIRQLTDAGVITYRSFADEYRIWQGTDLDLRRLLDVAHDRTRRQSLLEVLAHIDEPQPVVAARHSAEHDVLRVFSRRYVEGTESIEPLSPFSPFDGEVLLVVGQDRAVPVLAATDGPHKPVVAAIPTDLHELAAAAREVAAIRAVLEDPTVSEDWVARKELGERLAQATAAFEHAVASTFNSERCRWLLIGPDGATELPSGRGTAALSTAADLAYPSTPRVRNEMLNRTDVTSQGAKARRVLLEAMIERADQPDLGLEGYGPEMAMYRAMLGWTGMHRYDTRNKTMALRGPTDSTFRPAWDALQGQFRRAKTRRVNLNDVYAVLMSPPIGMKAAVVPVFVTAGLLACSDEVAIYEHGTFKPVLAPDLSERMVRNPGHFDIKHFANTTGARRQVIDALAERLGLHPRPHKHRVANVLAVVGHLVSRVRRLDRYTLRTTDLTAPTLRARDALVAAVEPDELLFQTLPQAFGFKPVPADTRTYRNARAYAAAVGDALDELTGRYDQLLNELIDELLTAAAETSRLAITGQAAALEGEVLDPDIRAVVLTLANDTVDADADWIQAVATVIVKKAPAEWTDEDRARYRREMPQRIAAFQRLVALHAHQRAEGGPFDALRVTFTAADGREHVRLASVDHKERQELEAKLRDLLDEFAEITRSRGAGQRAVLALLGEQLLGAATVHESQETVDLMEETIRYV